MQQHKWLLNNLPRKTFEGKLLNIGTNHLLSKTEVHNDVTHDAIRNALVNIYYKHIFNEKKINRRIERRNKVC